MEEGGSLWKEMECRDILLSFEEDGRRGDRGKETRVPGIGSCDEDTSIFPAQEEHRGELNLLSPTIG